MTGKSYGKEFLRDLIIGREQSAAPRVLLNPSHPSPCDLRRGGVVPLVAVQLEPRGGEETRGAVQRSAGRRLARLDPAHLVG